MIGIEDVGGLKKKRSFRPKAYPEREKWIYLLNNFHKLKEIPALLKESYSEKVINIAKNFNRTKMEELTDWAEELNDFFREIYQEDLAREAREIGMAEGMNMAIKSYLSANPYCSIEDAAAQLGVEEELIRSLFPVRANT